MSLGEILVVLIVGIIVLKPEDIPFMAKKIANLYKSVIQLKNEFYSEIQKVTDNDIHSEIEDINFYLKKIMEADGEYEGEYNLDSVKKFYHKQILKNHNKNR